MSLRGGGFCLGEYLPKEALHDSVLSVAVHLLLAVARGSKPSLSTTRKCHVHNLLFCTCEAAESTTQAPAVPGVGFRVVGELWYRDVVAICRKVHFWEDLGVTLVSPHGAPSLAAWGLKQLSVLPVHKLRLWWRGSWLYWDDLKVQGKWEFIAMDSTKLTTKASTRVWSVTGLNVFVNGKG